MWRPEGWDEIERELIEKPLREHKDVPRFASYWIGAGFDACLEALKKESQRVHDLPALSDEHIERALGNGYWVFIPEDKDA